MGLPVPLQTTPQPDLVGRLDPVAVGEAIRYGRPGAGEPLKNANGSPVDSLPTIERGSDLVVLPVSDLVLRIAAISCPPSDEAVSSISLRTGPVPTRA